MIKKVIDSLKYLKLKDIVAIFIFILVLPISLIYKLYLKMVKKEIWLICETKDTATDNGYHLYKYIRTKHPEVNCYYAIDKKCNDYNKIKDYGNIIQYESIKHWIYYLVASKNISTQKSGNPNPPLFYFLQVYGLLKNKRIFLQHGITINDSNWMYYRNTKFSLITCGAKKEYEFIKEKFGYPQENVKYLGFPRFDNLIDSSQENRQIVIMPTWRNWLGRDTNFLKKTENFQNTEYFERYNSLINNKEFIEFIEKNNITVYFYPHRNMQKYVNEFKSECENIKIVTNQQSDIQSLFCESNLMITDYSSVGMDFAYMKKPIIYYQFDIEKFRKLQLQEGYFDYKNDGFGKVIETEKELISEIKNIFYSNFKIEKEYLDKIECFFERNDRENCKRNFEAIKNI